MVGLAIALLCALTAGARRRSRSVRASDAPGARGAAPRRGAALRAAREARRSLGAAWRGARELLLDNPLTRLVARVALVGAVRRPGRVLCVGLALALLGWGLDTQTKVQTDITKLVPQNLGSLQDLDALERLTGVGGEIDLMVSARRTWRSRRRSNG